MSEFRIVEIQNGYLVSPYIPKEDYNPTKLTVYAPDLEGTPAAMAAIMAAAELNRSAQTVGGSAYADRQISAAKAQFQAQKDRALGNLPDARPLGVISL